MRANLPSEAVVPRESPGNIQLEFDRGGAILRYHSPGRWYRLWLPWTTEIRFSNQSLIWLYQTIHKLIRSHLQGGWEPNVAAAIERLEGALSRGEPPTLAQMRNDIIWALKYLGKEVQ